MKKDLRNVFLVFGLVITTALAGSFAYSAKIKRVQAREFGVHLAQVRIEDARAELATRFVTADNVSAVVIDEEVIKIQAESEVARLKKEAEAEQSRLAAVADIATEKASNQAVVAAERARQESILLAQQEQAIKNAQLAAENKAAADAAAKLAAERSAQLAIDQAAAKKKARQSRAS